MERGLVLSAEATRSYVLLTRKRLSHCLMLVRKQSSCPACRWRELIFVPSDPELRVARRPGHVRVMKRPEHRRGWQYEAVDHHPHQQGEASNLNDRIAGKQLLQGGQGARRELSQNECCPCDEYQLER
jgi:hypothetical protein